MIAGTLAAQLAAYNTDRYELVSYDELKKGDVIRIPGFVDNGQALNWLDRGYTVDRIEHKAPGVLFIWRDAETLPVGQERFLMMCGSKIDAGVLRVKSAEDEAPSKESDRLTHAMASIRRVHPSERTEEQREELRDANARLVELHSVPPEGYSTPKAAADLMAFAESHGWRTSAQWTALGYAGEPYLTVQVGHLVPVEQREDYRGDRWVYSLTWHSRDCAPGKTRRFGQGTAQTPDNPATHCAPSVKAIRDVIAANPAAVSAAA